MARNGRGLPTCRWFWLMRDTVDKKKALAITLFCSVLFVFAFTQINLDKTIVPPETIPYIYVQANNSTKNDLTAVFFFNNNYTKNTDNSTLNQEFLDYYIQRLNFIKSQVLGIKAFPFYFHINESYIYPEYNSSISGFEAKYEACNNTVALFLEGWYVLKAEVHFIYIKGFIKTG